MSGEAIAIAADHVGFDLKQLLAAYLAERGLEVLDLGTEGPDSVDYPDFADMLTSALADGKAGRGILICGSGIGMSIAANRKPGIRAALIHDAAAARIARQHNDANVLVLAGRTIAADVARHCVDAFLSTPFEGGRHARRVAKLA